MAKEVLASKLGCAATDFALQKKLSVVQPRSGGKPPELKKITDSPFNKFLGLFAAQLFDIPVERVAEQTLDNISNQQVAAGGSALTEAQRAQYFTPVSAVNGALKVLGFEDLQVQIPNKKSSTKDVSTLFGGLDCFATIEDEAFDFLNDDAE